MNLQQGVEHLAKKEISKAISAKNKKKSKKERKIGKGRGRSIVRGAQVEEAQRTPTNASR